MEDAPVFQPRSGRLLLFARRAAAVLGLVAPALANAQARSSTVEGTVRDAASNRPLEAVQVFVVGTSTGAVTNAQGQYRLVVPNVTGEFRIELRARTIGYTQVTRAANLVPDQVVRVDFGLAQSSLQLDQVVVTGSGQATEVKKLGNTIAIVKPPENMPMTDVSNILQGREPGLVGLPSGGLSGEGAKIRIRGNSSLSQTNEPIIFVDGIRINSGGGQAANGNVGSSRLDDFDPASIERVEILKGAAAATLYGTEASNGVIQIFTKRGNVGAPRWNVTMQQESIQMPDRVAPNSFFLRDDLRADSLRVNRPSAVAPLLGYTPVPYQVYEEPIFKDFLTENGAANTITAQVQGGTPTVTYFASVRNQSEDGPFGNNAIGPSDDLARRQQATVNLQLIPTSKLRIGLRTSYTNSYLRSPEANNNIYGSNSLAMMARPEAANCTNSAVAGRFSCTAAGNPFGNQAFMTVRESMQQLNEQSVSRFAGAMDLQYAFIEGLNFSLTGGYDFTAQRDVGFSPFGYNVDLFTAQTPDGARFVRQERQGVITVDSKLAWNKQINETWESSFVAGLQVFNNQTTWSSASSTNFPGPGIEVVGAGGANQLVGEAFATNINGGYFAQEQLSFNDYLTGTVGGRYDFSSAFGADAGGVFYPKVSVSYVVSDHRAVADRLPTWLSTFRLRGAWGQSGRQPGAFDKFTTFNPLASELGAGLVPANLGNPALKPEISTETEIGFEAGFLENQFSFEFTAWNRKVEDLLVAQQFAVSGGFQNTQLNNIGAMKANGLEMGLRWFAINTDRFATDFFFNAAYLKQTLTDLGGAPALKVGYIRYRGFLKEGYALGSIFSPRLAEICPAGGPRNNSAGQPIACYNPATEVPINFRGQGSPMTLTALATYLASNCPLASGAVRTQEVTFPGVGVRNVSTGCDLKNSGVQSDLRPLLADFDGNNNTGEQFVGDLIPDWTGSFGFNAKVGSSWRISSMFEYKTGFYIQNLTDGFRLSQHPSIGSNRRQWSEIESTLLNPAATPEQRVEAATDYIFAYRRLLEPGLHQHQRGDFTRLREIAVTWTAPEGLAARIGAKSFSVTASGRNLAIWTKYPGADPEANAIGRGIGTALEQNFLDSTDAFGLPIPRRFSLAFNYGF
jgi:TonB-linked SusC/RagA family outer membrane protein